MNNRNQPKNQKPQEWKRLKFESSNPPLCPVKIERKTKILLIGNYKDGYGAMYDMPNDTYPQILSETISKPGMTYDSENSKVYVWGGEHHPCFMIYDVKTESWEYIVTKNTPKETRTKYNVRHVGTGSRIICDGQQRLHVIGGSNSNAHMIFDPSQQVFKEQHIFEEVGNFFGFGLVFDHIRNRLILFGGCAGKKKLNDIWLFDLKKDCWRMMKDFSLEISACNFGFVFIPEIEVILLFGEDNTNNNEGNDAIWMLDINAKSCTQIKHIRCPGKHITHALFIPIINGAFIHVFSSDSHWCISLNSILPSKYNQSMLPRTTVYSPNQAPEEQKELNVSFIQAEGNEVECKDCKILHQKLHLKINDEYRKIIKNPYIFMFGISEYSKHSSLKDLIGVKTDRESICYLWTSSKFNYSVRIPVLDENGEDDILEVTGNEDVRAIPNLKKSFTLDDIKRYLNKIYQEINKKPTSKCPKFDALIIIISSHGKDSSNGAFGTTEIVCSNGEYYNVEEMKSFFKRNTMVEHMMESPVIFFIDVCRGNNHPNISTKKVKTRLGGKDIHSDSEFITVYSTTRGNMAAESEEGGILIQTLCKIMSERDLEINPLADMIKHMKRSSAKNCNDWNCVEEQSTSKFDIFFEKCHTERRILHCRDE